MNILTKICIVLLVPLILVACSVFLAFALTVPNYRAELDTQKAVNKGLGDLNLRLKDSLQNSNAQLVLATDESSRLSGQLAAERTERQQLWAKLAEGQGTILSAFDKVDKRDREFLQALAFFKDRTDKLLDENRLLREDYTKLAGEKAKLEDQNREARAAIARMEGEVRLLQEQIQDREVMIAELNRRIDELAEMQKKGSAGAPQEGLRGTAPPDTVVIDLSAGAPGAPKIVGKIIAIQNDIASVNIGKAHGITPGMMLVITHNDKFVGYLQIEKVEAAESAGIVRDKQIEPRQGDQVTYPSPAKAGIGDAR